MKSKNKLKKIKNRMCYCFDYIINGSKINFSNILLDKKLYENLPGYNIWYKTLTGPKPLHIRFNKLDGFIVSADGRIKHLILFDYGLFNEICDKMKYLMSQKSSNANSINHNFGKIKTDSYNSLPIKEILTLILILYFHNVMILIKSVVNKISSTLRTYLNKKYSKIDNGIIKY